MNWELALINVCLICILTVPHEFAHAWAADKLGDDTPEREGRLTLYPPAHIDPFGTILLPAIGSLLGGLLIGWGKPVNTTVSQLKYGLGGLALVALAGPASNILLAVLFAAIAVFGGSLFMPLSEFASQAARLSVYLALFNMIPLPPLDGSKLLLLANLPVAIYTELARFGFLLLIVLMASTPLGGMLGYATYVITNGIFGLFR